MRSDPPSIAASTSVPLGDAAVPLATRASPWPRERHLGHASVTLATTASPWPRERHLGHASVTLATTAVLGARFVGYFGRSRGQRARGVAKDAGRDAPGEARVAAVHRCGNAYGPGRVKPSSIRDSHPFAETRRPCGSSTSTGGRGRGDRLVFPGRGRAEVKSQAESLLVNPWSISERPIRARSGKAEEGGALGLCVDRRQRSRSGCGGSRAGQGLPRGSETGPAFLAPAAGSISR